MHSSFSIVAPKYCEQIGLRPLLSGRLNKNMHVNRPSDVFEVFQISYVRRGRATFWSPPSGQIHLEAGSAFILIPDQAHSYWPVDADGWIEDFVQFTGCFAVDLLQRGYFNPRSPVLRPQPQREFEQVMNRLVGYDDLSGELAIPLLFELICRCTPSFFASRRQTLREEVRIVIEAMEDSLHSPYFDLQSLATNLQISYSRLRQLFKQETGSSPVTWFTTQKMEAAKKLLLETDLTLAEIAVNFGYKNAFYFSRLFRRCTGLAPSQFRKNGRVGI